MQFAVSTYVFREEPLARAHLLAIAERGFAAVELFALRGHVNYDDSAAMTRLADWLAETGLSVASVHAPVASDAAALARCEWLSSASGAADARARSVRELTAALELSRLVPFPLLVMHLGVPERHASTPSDNQREAASRTLDEVLEAARSRGIGIALETLDNRLSRADALVRRCEEEDDEHALGICLDLGQAHLTGDAIEAVEVVSGHLLTTHLHDNRGRSDEHRAPFSGSIDWPAAVMAFRKIGFEGPFVFEVDAGADAARTLDSLASARERLARLASEA